MSYAWIDRIDAARTVKKQNRLRTSCFVIFLPFIFCFSVLCAEDTDSQKSLAQRVYKLKMEQKLLTQPYQDELETEVTKLKRAHGYTSAPLKKWWLARMFNYIPFYLWQIFVFCFWTILLLAWHKESIIVRCLLLAGLLFCSFALIILTKTSREITGFTLDETPLYVGPGSGYPQKNMLEPFSDVHILSVYPNKKTPIWHHVETTGQPTDHLANQEGAHPATQTGWIESKHVKLNL